MENGWQMNGTWKKNGIETEIFKKRHENLRFDRMIPSGSPWLMGIKVRRIVGRAHSMIKNKEDYQSKLDYMMGHTGKHLINTTTKYLGIQTTGKLSPCEHCAKGKYGKPIYQKFHPKL